MTERIHVREVSLSSDELEVRAAADGDGLTVSGYVARFDEEVEIEDWLGVYLEVIQRGAFARTLTERGPAKVKMQFNHGHDPAFGALPIGAWLSLREDRKGLYGEGRIHDTWHTIPIRAAIDSGALDGMSFKFKVVAEELRKAKKAGELDHRTITEVALFEAGPVVHPAYEGTTVALRSRAFDLCRDALSGDHHDREASPSCTLCGQEAVVPVGDTDPTRSVADPPVGITRRELRRMALSALGVIPDADSSGVPA